MLSRFLSGLASDCMWASMGKNGRGAVKCDAKDVVWLVADSAIHMRMCTDTFHLPMPHVALGSGAAG